MKSLFTLFFSMFFIPCLLLAQATIPFHEDFEAPSYADSVTSTNTIPGINDWNQSNVLHYQGSFSDTCTVMPNQASYLTTQSFSTLGKNYILLQFAQICKVDFLDIAMVYVSADNGTSWTQLAGGQYKGTGNYTLMGYRFACNTYDTLWHPVLHHDKPLNSWWKKEEFDVSSLIANTATAMVKFRLQDAGATGSLGDYGWCLDDIKIKAFPVVCNSSATYQANGMYVTFTGMTGGGSPPFTYFWDFGDGITDTTLNPTHHYVWSNTYKVVFTTTDSTGCTFTTVLTITVSPSTSSNEAISTLTTFIQGVYPNPVYDNFTMEVYSNREQQLSMNLFDVQGRLLLSETRTMSSGINHWQMTAGNLCHGFYLLTVTEADGTIHQQRINITR